MGRKQSRNINQQEKEIEILILKAKLKCKSTDLQPLHTRKAH